MGSRPSSSGDGNALLRRVGLSVLGSNVDFEQKARQEASDAERSLIELRQRSALQAAQCRGHLDVLSKEARAEEERRLISERVARELEKFREEMRKKEAKEEEHIRQMYRAILQPQPSSEAFAVQGLGTARQYQVDGAQIYPSIISSAVNLDAASVEDSFDVLDSSGFGSSEACLRREEDASHNRSHNITLPSYTIPHMSHELQTPPLPSRSVESSEAEQLLNLNLARLARLERLGL